MKISGAITIYIGNLNDSVTEDSLRGMFEEFGVVEQVYIKNRINSKGFGIVGMREIVDSKKAMRILQNLVKAKVAQLGEKSIQYWVDLEIAQRGRDFHRGKEGVKNGLLYLIGPRVQLTVEEIRLGEWALQHLVDQRRPIKVEQSPGETMTTPPFMLHPRDGKERARGTVHPSLRVR